MVPLRWTLCAAVALSAGFHVTSASAQSAGAAVAGRSVVFPGLTATYLPNGRYVVTTGGRRETGKWARKGDTLCIQFDSGVSRCDTYFYRGSQLFLRNSLGQVYAGRIR